MACTLAEHPSLPQVFPGSILKVMEGQEYSTLCAAEDDLLTTPLSGIPSEPPTATQQEPPPPRYRSAPSGSTFGSSDAGATASSATTTVSAVSRRDAHRSDSNGSHSRSRSRHDAPKTDRTDDKGTSDNWPFAKVACPSSLVDGKKEEEEQEGEEEGFTDLGRLERDDGCNGAGGEGEEGGFGYGTDGAAGGGVQDGRGLTTAQHQNHANEEEEEEETFSELSDPGATEVVFVREGVAVWPGAHTHRIPGRLSLVKQCGVLFMAWLPYSRGVLQPDGTFRLAANAAAAESAVFGGGDGTDGGSGRAAAAGGSGAPAVASALEDHTLYAVHPIALSEVRALKHRTPRLPGLGPPSLLVVLASGVTLPPLYFTSGGVRTLLGVLKQHVFLLQTAGDPTTYLINDTTDPLSRSLAPLHLSDVVIGGPPPGASATFQPGEGIVPPASTAAPPPLTAASAAATPHHVSYTRGCGAVTWASPAMGLGLGAGPGLAAAAGLACADGDGGSTAEARGVSGGRDGVSGEGRGGGGGGDGSTTSRRTARPAEIELMETAMTAAAAGMGNYLPMYGGRRDDVIGAGDSEEDDVMRTSISSGGARGSGHAWAYGIVDAINRFVQNVRGTASGWIGALEELDDVDGFLYGYHDSADLYNANAVVPRVHANMLAPQTPAHADGVVVTTTPESRRNEEMQYGDGTTSAVPPTLSSLSRQQPGWRFATTSCGPGTTNSEPLGGDVCAIPEFTLPSSYGRHIDAGGPLASPPDGPPAEVVTEVGEFELLDGQGCWGEAAAHPMGGHRRVRPPPLSAEEWAAMMDKDGRLVREVALRDRVTASSCTPELRREVWKHLLGMYPPGATAAQRAETAKRWQSDYQALRSQWQGLLPGQEARCAAWRAARCAVDKDVVRTDRGHPAFAVEGGTGLRGLRNVLLTHVVYDRDMGYCQGMSDLAAPLLVVMRDEAEAFWALVAVMGRLGANFRQDLAGMGEQLGALGKLVQLLDPPLHDYFQRRDCLSYHFAFRWLLVHFKREFKFDEVLGLWEAFWACRTTRHLHLYLAVAVLVQHRRIILSSDLDFDGLMRLALSLEGRLEAGPLLQLAEVLAGYAGAAGGEATAGLP